MAKVVGLGGIFFKSNDPFKLRDWYIEKLGFPAGHQDYPSIEFHYRDMADPEVKRYAVWGPFSKDTGYFGPSQKDYMVNLRVEDLEGLLQELRAKGITQVGEMEDHPYGKFAWIVDPEGTKIELWEPPVEPVE